MVIPTSTRGVTRYARSRNRASAASKRSRSATSLTSTRATAGPSHRTPSITLRLCVPRTKKSRTSRPPPKSSSLRFRTPPPGRNGYYQDEREFLKEMLAADAGNCLDAVGYHPYGFSADYDVEPDVDSPDPARKCVNGFCFRGVEKLYEIMQAHGLGSTQVWATEWGWITDPPAHCKNLPEWQGRLWQIVSEQKQADNLRGAVEHADAHWPWMGGMFVFNLDFNLADWYDECEQLRYYAVANRPAETVLTDMPKRPVLSTARLDVQVESIGALITPADQPLTRTVTVAIGNSGSVAMTWAAQSDTGAALIPALTPISGTLAPDESQTISVMWTSGMRPVGVYTGTIVLGPVPADTINAPAAIPITLVVAEQVYENTLPLITK